MATTPSKGALKAAPIKNELFSADYIRSSRRQATLDRGGVDAGERPPDRKVRCVGYRRNWFIKYKYLKLLI
jgi:hypothetical protein